MVNATNAILTSKASFADQLPPLNLRLFLLQSRDLVLGADYRLLVMLLFRILLLVDDLLIVFVVLLCFQLLLILW